MQLVAPLRLRERLRFSVLNNSTSSKMSSIPSFAIAISMHSIEKMTMIHEIAIITVQVIADVNRPQETVLTGKSTDKFRHVVNSSFFS